MIAHLDLKDKLRVLVDVSDMTQTLQHEAQTWSTRDRGLLPTSFAPKCAAHAHKSCTRVVLSSVLVFIAYDVDELIGAPIENTIDSLNAQLAEDYCFLSNPDLDSTSTQLND